MKALRRRELAAFFGLSALWSGNWLVIRIGLASLPPLRFAGLRMAIASVLLVPVALSSLRGRQVSRSQLRWIAVVGLLQIGVSYACVFTAEKWIESGLAALLFCSFPIWVGVLGHWMLPDEPLTARTVAAALLGVGGVAVIELPGLARVSSLEARPLAAGGALMMVSAIVSAFSAVTVKKRLASVPTAANVWGQSIVAALFLLSAAAAFEGKVTWKWTAGGLASLAYLSVVGTFVFLGSQWLVPRVPISLTGSFPLVNTVLAVVWGTLLAGEKLPARVVTGGALIFLGVALVTFEPRPARQPRLST